MPRLSVWAIRAALLYFGTAITIGALMVWHKGLPLHPQVWQLLPLHIELVLMGWMVQLALGVAYWILPRWFTERGNVRLAGAAFILLNMGVLLVVGSFYSPFFRPELALAGRVCQAAAALTFVFHAWPRVKAAGAGLTSHQKEV